MDQIRALEQVRDNIAQFGGDPQRVMIFGGSAGGTSTLLLLASPRAQGLFRSAIVHSMAAFTFTQADIESKGSLVEQGLGCANADPQAALDCMRSRSAHEVTTAFSNNMTMGSEGVVFGPAIDGFVLPGTIMSLLRAGRQQHVPVVVGSTADEFTTLVSSMLPQRLRDADEYRAAVTSYSSSIAHVVPADAILSSYPSAAYPSRQAAIIALVSDYVYTCPTRMVARTLTSTHRAPVRRFLFCPHSLQRGVESICRRPRFRAPFSLRPVAAGMGTDARHQRGSALSRDDPCVGQHGKRWRPRFARPWRVAHL